MTGIIPINPGTLAGEAVQTVNARDLHVFLEIETKFADWIKRRIDEYDFGKDQDYVVTFLKNEKRSNIKLTEYHLSLDMAKELAMVEKTEKGKQARRYFIECERRAKALASAPAASAFRHPAEDWLARATGYRYLAENNAILLCDLEQTLGLLLRSQSHLSDPERAIVCAVQDIAKRCARYLTEFGDSLEQVRDVTREAIETARRAVDDPELAAARSARARKAANARWDKERNRKSMQ